jgi:hypothetical protein
MSFTLRQVNHPARRRLVTISVTSNPTAAWLAGQITDAFPWDEGPGHLIRDRDGAFGPAYTRRIRANGDPRSSDRAIKRRRRADFANIVKNRQTKDSLAERNGFELPVPRMEGPEFVPV